MEKCEFEYLGPYHIEGVLGRGGMGTVYKGRHSKSGDWVAVKVIAPGVSDQVRFRRRFAAEVETLKRLRHPNIVQLIGYGEEQGLLFYSMEFVDGHSLHDHLRQHKRIDWMEVIQVGVEVTAALKHAHDLGIIHRDLKPANLMLTRDGHIKLTDFGIAKLFGSTEQTLIGSVIGTADFMPPEQAEGKNVTTRSDLYSLGSVMYALLTGQAPFGGKSVPEVLYAVRYTPAPDSVRLAPDAPAELHALIAEMLEKDPLKRPPTALVIGNRLKAMQQGLQKREAQRLSSLAPPSETDSKPDVVKELTSIDLSDDHVPEPKTSTSHIGTQERPTIIASQSAIARMVKATPINKPPAIPAGGKAAGAGREVDPKHTNQDGAAGSRELQMSVEMAGTLDSVPPNTAGSLTQSPANQSVSHFTSVDEKASRRFTFGHEVEETRVGPDWIQYGSIAGIVMLLIAAVAFGFWMIQPVSADALFAEINAAVESGEENALVDASDSLDEFVMRFPDDDRASEVRSWIDEAELLRVSRSVQRRASRVGIDQLSAIEQGFLVSLQARGRSWQEAREKFAAFVAVYQPLSELSAKDRRYVELAQVALARLGQSQQGGGTTPAGADLESIIRDGEKRLSGDALKSFHNSLIELYGDKIWAQDQLARIREQP